MIYKSLFTLVFLAASSFTVAAEEDVTSAPPPNGLDQDVTIVDRGSSVIEEYRAGGRIYMIRVVPKKGFPYYLIDADGDGSFETRRNQLAPNLLIPSWVIFSW